MSDESKVGMGALYKALIKAQKDLGPLKKVSTVDTGRFQYRYAPLDKVVEHVREALTQNGIWFYQGLKQRGENYTTLETVLFHEDGGTLRSVMRINAQAVSSQELGSMLTYYKRYMLLGMLGVAPEDEDDDANTADRKEGVTITHSKQPPAPETPKGALSAAVKKQTSPQSSAAATKWASKASQEIYSLSSIEAIDKWVQANQGRLSRLEAVNISQFKKVMEDVSASRAQLELATSGEGEKV